MIIRDHLLQSGGAFPATHRPSPNRGGPMRPEFLVMHYTAAASAQSAIEWLCNPAARASAHLVIGRDGAVTQLVPFDRRAWHAGRSRWQGRAGLNGFSLGIELDNAGVLAGGPGAWRTTWGRPVPDEEVVQLPHRHDGVVRGWHAFAPLQLLRAQEIAALLMATYGLRDVLGHDDVAPGRKTDPGPAFPMVAFRAAVLDLA